MACRPPPSKGGGSAWLCGGGPARAPGACHFRPPNEFLKDRLGNTVEIVEHLSVPDPEHAVALCFEPRSTPRVVRLLFGLIVLPAIDFDDEALTRADEIDDVASERMLAAKAMNCKLVFAQLTPELSLAVGHVITKSAGALVGHAVRLDQGG